MRDNSEYVRQFRRTPLSRSLSDLKKSFHDRWLETEILAGDTGLKIGPRRPSLIRVFGILGEGKIAIKRGRGKERGKERGGERRKVNVNVCVYVYVCMSAYVRVCSCD